MRSVLLVVKDNSHTETETMRHTYIKGFLALTKKVRQAEHDNNPTYLFAMIKAGEWRQRTKKEEPQTQLIILITAGQLSQYT